MYSYQKFTKHIAIVGIADLLGVLRGIVILPIITKLLGPKDYGIWSQIRITMSLMIPFVLLGLSHSLARFLPGEKDNNEIQEGIYSVLSLIFIISLIPALLLVIFSGMVADFFQCESVLIKILGLIIIMESLNNICFIVLRAFRQIEKYACFMIFRIFGEIGLVIGAVLLGYGLYGAVSSLLIIRLITFALLFISILKNIGFKIPRFSPIRKYLRFGLPTIADHISYWVITSIDRYLIVFFLGVLFVGYYAPAYSIAYILTLFLFPLAIVLSVVLCKFFDENKLDQVKSYLRYSLKYFLIIVIPSAFGLSVLSKQLLTIFSTEEIAANAYFVIPFIVFSILLYGVTYFFTQILALVKKTKLIAGIWVAAAFLNLGLNLAFIPSFGILGAALATLLSYFLAFSLMWYFAFKEFQFKIEWQFIFKSIAVSCLMILFLFWFNPSGLLNTILGIIFGIFIYGILMFLFKGLSKREIYFLKDLIFQAKKI